VWKRECGRESVEEGVWKKERRKSAAAPCSQSLGEFEFEGRAYFNSCWTICCIILIVRFMDAGITAQHLLGDQVGQFHWNTVVASYYQCNATGSRSLITTKQLSCSFNRCSPITLPRPYSVYHERRLFFFFFFFFFFAITSLSSSSVFTPRDFNILPSKGARTKLIVATWRNN